MADTLLPPHHWLDDIFDIRRPLTTRSGAAVEVNFLEEIWTSFFGRVDGLDEDIRWCSKTGKELGGRVELDLFSAHDPFPLDDRFSRLN